MTTSQLGSLIIDLEGKDLSPEERELLNHPLVGGVIFFTRNFDSRSQIKDLCHEIRSASKKPLLKMVDQEGGRVQRFIKDFTRLPNMGKVGEGYGKNAQQALGLARDTGWLMATELLSVGIDLSLAPVLDLNTGISSVIGDRAFHHHPDAISQLAGAFIQGMKEAGMAATGKHFPGHGSIAPDSHVSIPIDQRDKQTILKQDLIPFMALIKSGITALMAAHIIFPQIDQVPVGFSSVWLKQILRDELKFTGLVFSDDLNMEGAKISTKSNYCDRVVAALEAGCDFALLCNNRKAVIEVLDNVPYSAYQVSAERYGVLQGQFANVPADFQNTPRWKATREILSNLIQPVQI